MTSDALVSDDDQIFPYQIQFELKVRRCKMFLVNKRKCLKNKMSCMKSLKKSFAEYSEQSSIHSLGYIGKMDIHWSERFFWIVAFFISLIACIYLMSSTYAKWQSAPILVSFNERATPAWQVPFPAITICPESKTSADVLDIDSLIKSTMNNQRISDEEQMSLEALYQVCDFKWKLDKKRNLSNIDYINVLKKIIPNYPSTSFVEWKGKQQNYSDYFYETTTEEGICTTFNMLDQKDLYRKGIHSSLKNPYHGTRSNWTLFGYDTLKGETYPHRILGAGKKAGLTLQLAMKKTDINYACKTAINGYRMTLHTPGDFPRPSTQFYSIPFDASSLVSVKLRVISTARTLRNYSPKVRQCYFHGEKKLKFFKIYTQSNCELECMAEFVYNECGCVRFSMPRDNVTKVCDDAQEKCVDRTEFKWIMNVIRFSRAFHQ